MDMNKKYSYLLVFVALLLMGCSDHLADDAGTSDSAFDASDIQVGSVQLTTDADGVTATTRATAAVDVDYLKAYLERGLPIRYSQELTPTAFQFANLQLTGDDYTITGWETETPAKWLYNGKHYFQSTAWPTAIIGATGEGTTFDAADQSGDNYTALSEALAISPSFQVSATVGKITIPYSHRMARVIAYILIDPSSRSIKLIQVPESVNVADQTSLIMLGGEPYLMIKKDQDSYFGKVDSDGGVDRVASFTGEDELSFPNSLVYRETKASWVTNGKRYVFDPQAKLFTDKQLPAHYPGQESSYCDGVAYVVEQQGALPSSFFKCDLIADAAEERNVSWSAEAQNYGLQTVPGGASYRFMSASKTLVRTASLVDGRSISFYIDVEKNSGSCMVSGSQQSGQLVSTLVRLN